MCHLKKGVSNHNKKINFCYSALYNYYFLKIRKSRWFWSSEMFFKESGLCFCGKKSTKVRGGPKKQNKHATYFMIGPKLKLTNLA
jgi:hypothetical protein